LTSDHEIRYYQGMGNQFKVGDRVKFKSAEQAVRGIGCSPERAARLLNKVFTVKGVLLPRGSTLVHLSNGIGVYPKRLVKVRKVVTPQGIFDHVYRFLVRQGRASVAGGECKYRIRQEDGEVLACAAGCLLSDEEAEDVREGRNWACQPIPDRFIGHDRIIYALQDIHDRMGWKHYSTPSLFVQAFKNEMASYAALHGLTVPTDV
jgi:hypothetical protein